MSEMEVEYAILVRVLEWEEWPHSHDIDRWESAMSVTDEIVIAHFGTFRAAQVWAEQNEDMLTHEGGRYRILPMQRRYLGGSHGEAT